MRIIGLLSWFMEKPDDLRRSIISTSPLIDELVCLDGRYQLFPRSENRSTSDEYKAIREACKEQDLPVTIVSVDEPFDGPDGGEVAKRSMLFDLGFKQNPDWFYVFDADMIVTQINQGWREKLEATDLNVATVMLADEDIAKPHPAFFRALDGLTVEKRHWRYVAKDEVLWDYPQLVTNPERCDTFKQIVIEHEHKRRISTRIRERNSYYKERDRHQVEKHPAQLDVTTTEAMEAATKLRSALEKGASRTPGSGRTESRTVN